MKYKILPFLLLCLVNFSFAQVPGYMGKRLMLSGSFLFGSPEFLGVDPATVHSKKIMTTSGDVYGLGFHGYVKAAIDYVVADHTSLCLAYNMSKMGFRHENSAANIDYLTQLNISAFEFGFRYHSRGNIAPFGNYFSCGISLNTALEKDAAGNLRTDSIPFKETKTTFASVFFNIGHNFIIGKSIVITPQFETNITNFIPFINEDHSYQSMVTYRWQKSVWLNLGLGIGFLIH